MHEPPGPAPQPDTRPARGRADSAAGAGTADALATAAALAGVSAPIAARDPAADADDVADGTGRAAKEAGLAADEAGLVADKAGLAREGAGLGLDGGPVADGGAAGGGAAAGGGFRHELMFYDTPDDYRSAVLRFVREGLSRAEPVLVAVPGAAGDAVREGLKGQGSQVVFADMAQLGLNPARIIAAIWDFVERHHGSQVRFVTEPAWPGRSAAEAREVAVHEAMVNLAFAAAPVAVLCPYDMTRLAPAITRGAACTHPVILTSQGTRPSAEYVAGRAPRAARRPLPDPPGRAQRLPYATDLRAVRQFVAAGAARAGLSVDRIGDLVLAAGEVAANTVRHSPGGGIAHIWRGRGEVICQVADTGRIGDPLAGRRRPPGPSGLGLWVVHQVCDLVELRTGRRGTTVRMHMALPA